MPKVFTSITASLMAIGAVAIGSSMPALAYASKGFPGTSGAAPTSSPVPMLAIAAALAGLVLIMAGVTALARRRS